jgi:hypothetical protein
MGIARLAAVIQQIATCPAYYSSCRLCKDVQHLVRPICKTVAVSKGYVLKQSSFIPRSKVLMSSSPQKPQYQPSWAFEVRVQQVADESERRVGRLPVWLHELDLERIVPLLAGCSVLVCSCLQVTR